MCTTTVLHRYLLTDAAFLHTYVCVYCYDHDDDCDDYDSHETYISQGSNGAGKKLNLQKVLRSILNLLEDGNGDDGSTCGFTSNR